MITFKQFDAGTQVWIKSVFTPHVLRYFDPPSMDATNVNRKYIREVAHWKSFDTDRLFLERKWAKLFQTAFAGYRGDLVASWLQFPIPNVTIQKALRIIDTKVNSLIQTLYTDVEQHFLNRLQPPKKANNIIKPSDIEDLIGWNKKMLVSRITGMKASTEKKLKAFFAREIKKGTSIQDIAKKLEAQYSFSPTRAMRIARTEVVSSANAATYFGNAAAIDPSELQKDWMATNDRRTRMTHVKAGASQKNVKYDKPFKVGKALMMFPGDSSLGAGAKEIVNCRCTMTTSFRTAKKPGRRKRS